MGFQNAIKNEFCGFGDLVIWLWKSFGEISEVFLKDFVRILQVVVSHGGHKIVCAFSAILSQIRRAFRQK